MIMLSVLVYLPAWSVATFGVVMIASHNLFDSVESANPIWSILHSPNFILNSPGHIVFVAYVLIPWVGVTAAGYGLGQVYRGRRNGAEGSCCAWALALTVGFYRVARHQSSTVIRCLGPRRRSAAFTVLSFLNTTKYPPSLLYLLMTLGPAMLFLWAVDGRNAAMAAARAHRRQGADVLLPAAHTAHSSARSRRVLRPLWTGTLDVRIADASVNFPSRRRRAGDTLCRSFIWSGFSWCLRFIHCADGLRT